MGKRRRRTIQERLQIAYAELAQAFERTIAVMEASGRPDSADWLREIRDRFAATAPAEGDNHAQ